MTEKDPRHGADGPVDDDADDVDSYGDDGVERPDEEPALDSEAEDAENPDDGE